MCYELVTECKHCGVQRHYSWERCREQQEALEEACTAGIRPPRPSECDKVPVEIRKRPIRDMTVYECPVPECQSTGLAKRLLEQRAKDQAAQEAVWRKARLEQEARKKAEQDRFARKYFRKLPVAAYAPHMIIHEDAEGEEQEEAAEKKKKRATEGATVASAIENPRAETVAAET